MLANVTSFEKYQTMLDYGCQLVAVQATMMFDHETVLTLASRFCEREHFFLLESATTGPKGLSRYSFLGFDPIWEFKVSKGFYEIIEDGNHTKQTCLTYDPISTFWHHFSSLNLANKVICDELDLSEMGGAIGWISYDIARYLEPTIGKVPSQQLKLPEMFFFIPKLLMVVDQLTKKLHLIHYQQTKKTPSFTPSQLYQEAISYLNHIANQLSKPVFLAPLKVSNHPLDWESCKQVIDKTSYLNQVKSCLEHIKAGDIFQIQLGNRINYPVKAHPLDIFRHLRILNPSPYMFFYRKSDHTLLGASPEMMVGLESQIITHRPIAGTRKRSWNPQKDKLMREQLVSSEKERAEHVMLVDLSRNDIGRIAQPKTVTVDELMVVEEYSHVFHMVSQVSGHLRNGLTAADAMIASFPNGTVSGAPKIKAMELIYKYERCAREFYAGSLAFFTFSGNLKSTILIRSLHIKDNIASTQASAGIVYDSYPEHEWEETRHKMAACLTAIQNTL